MPRWLLGTILGLITAGLDYLSAARADISDSEILVLSAGRILIGLIIGSNIFIRLPRNYRWMRGAIIGYLIDRILSENPNLPHVDSEK